jgi:hypothetical protein
VVRAQRLAIHGAGRTGRVYHPRLAALQVAIVGLCILSDQRAEPIYQRWIGFASLWTAVLFVPGALIPYFKHGPFTWRGLVGFWLPATMFFVWYVLMWLSTVRTIKRGNNDQQYAQ